jgi:intraflagellar transport protein 74
LAQQIEDSLNELSDYNTLLDRLNTSSNIQDINKDYLILKTQNDEQSKELDEYFIEKTKKEDLIKKIEKEIELEKRKREKILEKLHGTQREKYEKIKIENDRLQEEMNKEQNKINKLKDNVNTMKEQISLSSIKLEAAQLLDNLYEYELKREHLKEELLNKLNPQEEREMLVKQVKQDNLEIVSIEKQINELKENKESIKRDLNEQQLNNNNNQLQSKSQQLNEDDTKKYKELKKRELQMDEFMNIFDDNKRNELDLLQLTRKNINGLLEVISKHELRTKQQDSLLVQSSSSNLNNNNYKMSDLLKVNELEIQIKKELIELKDKLNKMNKDLIIFNDLDNLKEKSLARKEQLIVEKQNLTKYKENVKYEIESLYMQVQTIEAQLNDNETHNQLCSLEKKLQNIEQQNYLIKDAINQYQANSSFENMKNKVMILIKEHNKWLQEQLQKPTY